MSKRTYEQITESERHAIALGLQQKQSLRAIARALGRSPSSAAVSAASIAAPSPNYCAQASCSSRCASIYASIGRPSKLPGN